MKQDYPIRTLCETFEVSSSGYYDWKKRLVEPSNRAQEDLVLKGQILRIHRESRKTYGSPRIQAVLAQEGSLHGRNRIAPLMREEGLFGRSKRRYRVITTESRHNQPIAPNHLANASAPHAPNQIWAGDITYVWTQEGWLYVATLMDLYSRRVVGWTMSPRIDTDACLRRMENGVGASETSSRSNISFRSWGSICQ